MNVRFRVDLTQAERDELLMWWTAPAPSNELP